MASPAERRAKHTKVLERKKVEKTEKKNLEKVLNKLPSRVKKFPRKKNN